MSTQTTSSRLETPVAISWLTIDQWQSYVEDHAESTSFHHCSWLELLRDQYGFEIHIAALFREGEIAAAIPLLQTRNLRGTKKLISLPFTDYLPYVASDHQSVETLCHLIRDEFRGRIETVVVRGDIPVAGLENASHHVRHELRTDRPMDEIELSFASAIKRNLRKGKREQLEFEKRNDDDAIEIFYRLHVLTRKKLGVPVQSKSYFRRLSAKLIKPGLGCIGIVKHANTPIAAVVLLGFNGRLTYKYAASDPSALEHRPNDWLVYNAIRIASEEEYRFFDFGISDKNQEGLRRFKSKWGATESEIFYSYVLGQSDSDGGQSRAMRIAAEVIKRSPTMVCRALGSAFYKYSQ
jgi:lipid II:glycine glycyltransferase (peptidoglycan interpeptide bridge formation enzyme)